MPTLHFLILLLLSAGASSAAVFVVTSAADTGPGSLRDSITSANNSVGWDAIHFSLPGSGVRTILPETPLPEVTSPVTIDGYTQPGSHANTFEWDNDALLLVRLDGVKLTNGLPSALVLKAGGCLIRGLILARFSSGIKIDNASNNTIAGNWIGLDWDGVARGMTFDGITVTCPVFGSARFNTIGGPSPADRNVISGNSKGVTFFPTTAANNSVINNFIGTDARGRLPRGNAFECVGIQSATNILVSKNVLCAGGGSGVSLVGGSGHVIQNNLIGLGAAAWTGLGNDGDGITANGASHLLIGGTDAGNFIGFNRGHGVFLLGGTGSSVTHNRIGTGSAGFEPFGNTRSGVCLQESSTNHVANNEILFSGESGVAVFSGVANEITANQIYDNAGPGIDLGADNVTLNDPGDADTGANEWQNYPELQTATLSGGTLVVDGFLDTHPSTTCRVDFYASDSWDPLSVAEGQWFLGSTTVTTDPLGTAVVHFSDTSQLWGSDIRITATATDLLGNTSEFSFGIPVVVQPAPPSLRLVATASVLTVCWPLDAIGFDLETTPSLAPPQTWATITVGIFQTPTSFCYAVTDSAALPSQFFRLKKR